MTRKIMGSAIQMNGADTDLRISISASSFSELLAGLTKLKAEIEAAGVTLGDVGVVSETEVSAKPTRTRKAKTEPTPAAENANEAPAQPVQTTIAPTAETPASAPTAAVNAVVDLSPEDARKKGIEEMQKYFGANPNAMPDIKRLQTKFGVKMFQDIPDDQAHAFYADVKLLTSGNAQAA